MNATDTPEAVKEYYGRVLQSPTIPGPRPAARPRACRCTCGPIEAELHDEVRNRSWLRLADPAVLEGATVLDLGCGSGRDTFMLSKLVGPSGRVIGVDMTDEQLAVARRHRDYHAQKFGYAESNVQLVQAHIEDRSRALASPMNRSMW